MVHILFINLIISLGERFMAQDTGIVTILFCDIYEFDSIISSA